VEPDTLLLVDDDGLALHSLVRVLRSKQLRIFTTATANAAENTACGACFTIQLPKDRA
jgi:hypothetical protein